MMIEIKDPFEKYSRKDNEIGNALRAVFKPIGKVAFYAVIIAIELAGAAFKMLQMFIVSINKASDSVRAGQKKMDKKMSKFSEKIREG